MRTNAEAANDLSERTVEILHLVVSRVPLTEVTAELENDTMKLYK